MKGEIRASAPRRPQRQGMTPRILRFSACPLLSTGTPPAWDAAAADAVARAERRIAEHPHHYNGPVAMILRADPQRIITYPATYAHALAHRELQRDGRSPFGSGHLGVTLILRDRDGDALWTRRSERVELPHTWGASVAGGVDPGEHPADAALREAHEELAIERAHVSGLRVTGALITLSGCTLIYTGTLAPSAAITANPAEVSELAWAADMRELDGEIVPGTDLIYQAASAALPDLLAA